MKKQQSNKRIIEPQKTEKYVRNYQSKKKTSTSIQYKIFPFSYKRINAHKKNQTCRKKQTFNKNQTHITDSFSNKIFLIFCFKYNLTDFFVG